VSKLVPKLFGVVKKSKVVLDDRLAYIRHLAGMEGKRVELVVHPVRKARTDNQNAYYFGVAIALIADHTGYTADEAHDAMKMMFLKVRGENGFPDRIRSTTDLSTAEFSEYVEHIKRWASTALGIYIPDAGDVMQM